MYPTYRWQTFSAEPTLADVIGVDVDTIALLCAGFATALIIWTWASHAVVKNAALAWSG